MVHVRRRIATIWLILALIPSLWFSLVGALPHSHRQVLPLVATSALVDVPGDEAIIDALTDQPVADDCALCQWALASTACLLLVTLLTLPRFFSASLLGRRIDVTLALQTMLPSRAPPALALSV